MPVFLRFRVKLLKLKNVHRCFLILGIWGIVTLPFLGHSQQLAIEVIDKPIPAPIESWDNALMASSPKTFKNVLDSLSSQLQKMGFLEAAFSPPQKINDSLFRSQLLVGNKVTLVRITISHSVPNELATLLPVQKIPFSTTAALLNQLVATSAEIGYPFASFELRPIERNGEELLAQLEVSLGKLRTLDAIKVKGYDRFPISFLKQTGRFFFKKPFQERSLQKMHQSFKKLPFVTAIREPEVLFTQDSTVAYLYFKRKPNNYIEGFLGFESNNSGGIRFNGNLDARLLNNLHQGEQLNLLYQNDGALQRNFSVALQWPYVLQTPIGTETGLEIFTRDSIFVTSKQFLKLSVPLRQDLRVWTGLELANGSSLEAQTTLPSFQTTSFTLEIEKEFAANDPYFATPSFVKGHVAWGKRSVGAEKTSQYRLGLSSQYMLSLAERSQYIARLSGKTFISDALYTHELFRLGGILSLRGFSDNQLLTDRYLLLNQEYRYLLSPDSYVLGLIDNALLHDDFWGNQWLLGIGAGLGIRTAGGMLQLQYVLGKTPQLPFSFKDAKVHLRFSSFF